MRIPSGVTDQYIYFVAVDSTDFTTRETGLTTFTVYRSRNGAAAAAMTTPTINEVDATNMPGVYELLLDEDMTIGSGNDSEEMAFHITQASMAPVTRTIELYRPKITAGNTLDCTATGAAGIDWGNIENPTTAVDLSGTDIQLCDTVTTNTDMRGTDSAATAANLATVDTNVDTLVTRVPNTLNTTVTGNIGIDWANVENPTTAVDLSATDIQLCDTVTTNTDMRGTDSAATAAALATVDANVDAILVDTGTDIPARFDGIEGATFSTSTDSLEAIRDRGDAAWVTGGGGGLTQILNVVPLIPPAIDLANTASYRLGLALVNSLDDLPTTAEITPGTIDIDRKAVGGTSWTSVVAGAACSEAAGLVYYDEVFDSGTGYAEGDMLRVTFYSQSITADSNTHEVSDATEGRIFYTGILEGTADVNVTQVGGQTASATATVDFDDLAAILTDTGTTIPGVLGTPAGADLAADIATVDSNVDLVLADTGTDGVVIAAAQTVATVTDVTNQVSADVTAISGSTTAADNLEESTEAIITGTAQTGTLSTTQATTNLTGYADDELIGREIIFKSGTANGQASTISDYANASGLVTFDAITTAPANGDLFVIV